LICCNEQANSNPGPGRFVESPAGAFYFPRSLPIDKSPPQSPTVVMTPHHINSYRVVEEKNECNDLKIHPYEEITRGAE